MKSLEMTGKTVDEAIEKALLELNTTRDEVQVEVIDKGNKGFLNLIGTKLAKVKVTLVKNHTKEADRFLKDVLSTMGIEAKIVIKEEKDKIVINLDGDNMGLLIGYRGETLDALQYLVSLTINKDNEEAYKRVVLDTQNYRAKREETLIKLADKIAYRVRNYNRPVKLEPMNPYERRIIHSALQDNPYVYTFSEGEEPYRRVVVELKRKPRGESR